MFGVICKSLVQNAGGKKLFTPGPLNCTKSVKAAMLRDMGSRDSEFINVVREIRHKLLDIVHAPTTEYAAILLQGSGTFCVEAALQTCTPRHGGRVLVVSNGAYGKRMKTICDVGEIASDILEFPEDQIFDISEVVRHLDRHPYTVVAAVHLETSSGVINPIIQLGEAVHRNGLLYVVDAMSSLGGVEMTLLGPGAPDIIISSANKCIQGVPGFGFILARKATIALCKGNCRSLSLDLYAQLEGLDNLGQFRFTPPTHVILAFQHALLELEKEGGVSARAKRYRENFITLDKGMTKLGFKKLVENDSHRGNIITTYCYPSQKFDFERFYHALSEKGQVIYPGKVTKSDCFRIGNIGDLFPSDMVNLVQCVEEVLQEMGLTVPLKY